jgi:hypothetical protein
MSYLLVFGILLAGGGAGALLMALIYLAQLRKVKTDLQTARRWQQDHDAKDKQRERRPA